MIEKPNSGQILISVVIPAFNEFKNLEKLIPHLLDIGRNSNIELIVSFADHNGDQYRELENCTEVNFVQSPKKCRAYQLNLGAKHAQGSILAFLHADVWPPQDFFNHISNTIKAGFEAGLFAYKFNRDSFLLNLNASFTKRDGIFTGGGDQCLFLTQKTFNKLGGFDEDQVIMEDFEFFKRLKSAGHKYRIVDEDLIVSSRKYDYNSYLRVNLSNLLLVVLFKCNYPPGTLKNLHNKLIRVPHLEEN